MITPWLENSLFVNKNDFCDQGLILMEESLGICQKYNVALFVSLLGCYVLFVVVNRRGLLMSA